MANEKLELLFLDAHVLPDRSPGTVLALDTSRLLQRGGVGVLRSLILELRRLYGEGMRLSDAGWPVVPVFEIGALSIVIKAVAVDVDAGQSKLDGADAIGEEPLPAPIGDGATDVDSRDRGAAPERDAVPDVGPAEPPSDPVAAAKHEEEVDAALRLALALLKRFAGGELQTYGEMESAIALSPLPNLTRRYVARVRLDEHPIVTRTGIVDWSGVRGIGAPLPEAKPAGIDARVYEVDEKGGTARLEVARLHGEDRRYKDELSPALGRRVIEVVVPNAQHRALLSVAMPRGWPVRLVLSLGRPLLTPSSVTYTAMHVHILSPAPDVCKDEIDEVINASPTEPHQPEIWD